MPDLLNDPAFFARSYASVDLARRALQRINTQLSANTAAYCTAATIDGTPVVAAVTLTRQGQQRLRSAPWGGDPYELDDELRRALSARLAELVGKVDADRLPAEGYVRRGTNAGVHLRADGTTRPANRPQG